MLKHGNLVMLVKSDSKSDALSIELQALSPLIPPHKCKVKIKSFHPSKKLKGKRKK